MFFPPAGFGGTSCEQCPANTFSAGGSLRPCEACGPRQVSPPGSPSRDFCACREGEGLVDNNATCSVCPANTYSLGLLSVAGSSLLTAEVPVRAAGLAVCQRCEGVRISPAGSTSPDDCGKSTDSTAVY